MDISHHIKRIQPDFQGNCYVEEAKCMFPLTDEEKEKCKYTYKDRETYGFILSNAYILGLFCICEDARRDFSFFHTEQDNSAIQKMISLRNIEQVLFQCLLLDDVWEEDGFICAKLYTIYCIK